MSQMMVDKSKACIGFPEARSKRFLPVVLTGQTHVPAQQTRDSGVVDRVISFDHAFEIMANGNTYRRPSETHKIQLICVDGSKIEAGANRKFGKSGVMLDATQAFLRDCKKNFTIPCDAGGGVVHLRIIDSD